MNGVIFGTKHSYRDFGLILTSKSIPLPEPKTSTVDIPGADGSLDMSTILTNGDVKYSNRKLQFVFTVIEPNKNWENAKSKFANYLQGKKINITLDIDRAFFYVGRCSISSFDEDKRTAQITVDVDAEPYKYDILTSDENWQWDDFNFYNGIIYNLGEITVVDESTITIPNRRKSIIPSITVSADMLCVFNGVTYDLTAGTQKVLGIVLIEGENTLKFVGNGTVTIAFRGGSL